MGMEARSFNATEIGSKIRTIEAGSVTPYYRETSLDSLRDPSTRSRVPEIGKSMTRRH